MAPPGSTEQPQTLWVKYGENRAVKLRLDPHSDVADLLAAYRKDSLLRDTPLELITLHSQVDGEETTYNAWDTLESLKPAGTEGQNPLIIRAARQGNVIG